MATSGHSAPGRRRYLARLPWIGPLLDATLRPDLPLRIGAASDPLLGEAHAVVLLPDPPHAARGWIAAPSSDRLGRFRVAAPADMPDGARALLVLLYDQSIRPAGARFPGDWRKIAELDSSVREAVQTAIAELLERPASELRRGFLEYRGAAASRVAFAVASCQYPAGFIDREPAEASYRRLCRLLDGGMAAPDCLLLLGDQVYLDATAGLFDPTAQHDRFDLPYERMLTAKPVQEVLRRVPAYMMLDDHEIQDNWEPVAGDSESARNLAEGRRSYFRYQRLAGPDEVPPGGDSRDPLWYTFAVGPFPFFMADTRSERQPRTAEAIDQARIMSKRQFRSLRNWLDGQEARGAGIPKFVASPACFLPRHRRAAQHRHPASALRSDGWDGYPRSFYSLLAHIARKRMRNVVFLSGDEHVSFAVRADVTDERSGNTTRVYSIHSSGLYSPFPFANAVHDSLSCDEEFRFSHYRCKVATLDVTAGDGFALIDAAYDKDTDRARLRLRFDREAAPEKWIDVL